MLGFNFIPYKPKLREERIELYKAINDLNKVVNVYNRDIIREEIKGIRFTLNHGVRTLLWGKRSIGRFPVERYINVAEKFNALKRERIRIRTEREKAKSLIYEEVHKFGYKFYKLGGCFKDSAASFKKRYSPRDAFNNKLPQTKKNYIGVELEMCSSISRDQWAILLAENQLTHKVNIHSDGSIRIETNNIPHQVELAILDTEENIKKTLHQLQRVLDNPNYDFAVNNSCGTHIHLDMRNRDHKESYSQLFKNMSYIISLADSSRKGNTYCAPNTATTFDAALTSQNERGSRYQVINPEAYRKYKTLEVRVFEGTLDMSKVCNWIDCLLNILNSEESKEVKSV